MRECTATGCGFGAALAGLLLHIKLPDHHLDGDSRDVIKAVMGLVATMAALVLGLLIASAQSSYNAQAGSLQRLAADVVQLDHMLALYGDEAHDARALLREGVVLVHERVWSPEGVQAQKLDPRDLRAQADRFLDAIQTLAPSTDGQRFAQAQAQQLSMDVARTRALMRNPTAPEPFTSQKPRFIMHLANCQNLTSPTDSSDEAQIQEELDVSDDGRRGDGTVAGYS